MVHYRNIFNRKQDVEKVRREQHRINESAIQIYAEKHRKKKWEGEKTDMLIQKNQRKQKE